MKLNLVNNIIHFNNKPFNKIYNRFLKTTIKRYYKIYSKCIIHLIIRNQREN